MNTDDTWLDNINVTSAALSTKTLGVNASDKEVAKQPLADVTLALTSVVTALVNGLGVLITDLTADPNNVIAASPFALSTLGMDDLPDLRSFIAQGNFVHPDDIDIATANVSNNITAPYVIRLLRRRADETTHYVDMEVQGYKVSTADGRDLRFTIWKRR